MDRLEATVRIVEALLKGELKDKVFPTGVNRSGGAWLRVSGGTSASRGERWVRRGKY